MNSHSENSSTAEIHARRCHGKGSTNHDWRRVISIDMLPDDVLLEIFDFYVYGDMDETRKRYYEVWKTLVHVCRRWRCIVFGSPCRLDLRLVCTAKTPARDLLDVWPDLPLSIECGGDYRLDDIIAVLECEDRVEEIELFDIDSSLQSEKVLAAMRVSFPYLRELRLSSKAETVPILLHSLLGLEAPCLDTLSLDGFSFPGLSKLLLSATNLVFLRLERIPNSGYISPKAMLNALSKLTSLESLCLGLYSFLYRPHSARQHPRPRFVLPALTVFRFEGDSEYLEDLVARIDAPQLSDLHTMFFNETVFDAPRLFQFIRCTSRLKTFEKAGVVFEDGSVRIILWQPSNLEQVCTSSESPPPPSIQADLHTGNYKAQYFRPGWQGNIEDNLWLELSLPFGAVKELHLSKEFVERIVPTLQNLVGRRTTDPGAFPILQNIFLEGLPPSGPVQEGIRQLVASQQVTGHPITVSRWDRLADRTGFQAIDG